MLFTDPGRDDPTGSTFLPRKKPNFRTTNKSYEDVLIEKYIDHIDESNNSQPQVSRPRRNKLEIDSPYLQKLSHSNFLSHTAVPTSVKMTRANSRQTSVRTRPSSANPGDKYEAAFKQVSIRFFKSESSEDLAKAKKISNRGQLQTSSVRDRPASAPLNKNGTKRSVLRQPNMIKAVAYRNGNRHYSVFIAAKSLVDFLIQATEKLEFPRAARRCFLENGDEIKDASQFFNNAPVYVSCGEDFEDPFQQTKRVTDNRNRTLWLSNGIQFLDANTTTSNNNNSKYTERQAKSIKFTKRLLVMENGHEHDPVVVVIETKNLDDIEQTEDNLEYLEAFLGECTARLKAPTSLRLVYNWLGERVQALGDVPKIDKCLQALLCRCEYAPVWVSKGEGFDASGALRFVENLIGQVKEAKKELAERLARLVGVGRKLGGGRSGKLQKVENAESAKKVRGELKEVDGSIEELRRVVEVLEGLYERQRSDQGQSALYKHIKEVELGVGNRPLKLKACVNGGSEERVFSVLINAKDLKIWDHVLMEIDNAYYKHDRLNYAQKFTRVFDESGQELKELSYSKHNQSLVWVSTGENWKDPRANVTLALSIKLSSLIPVPLSPSNLPTPDEPVDKPSQKASDSSDGDDSSDVLSDQNEKDLANFFKSGPKFSRKKKKATAGTAAPTKNTNPFETADEPAAFRTFAEPLRPERLASLCKPDDWQVLNDTDARQIVAALAAESSTNPPGDDSQSEVNQTRATDLLLQASSLKSLLLLPRLAVDKKAQVKAKDLVWYTDFQVWRFNQDGLIYNGFFKKMCLSVRREVTVEIEISLKNGPPMIRTGHLVTLAPRSETDLEQKWAFTKYGTIVSRCLGREWCLTSMKVLSGDLEKTGLVESHRLRVVGESGGWQVGDVELVVVESWHPLVVSDEADGKSEARLMRELAASQHWAIKQDRREAKMNREWRHSVLATSKWLRESYSWPVNDKEEYITEFTWPLSGHLIPAAPLLKTLQDLTDPTTSDPFKLTLRICRNGQPSTQPAPITFHRSSKGDKDKREQHELDSFLDRCSSVLGLATPARRLFTEAGTEVTSLDSLASGQLLLVSTGEVWMPAKTVKEDAERKLMLANLAEDLNKLAFFNRVKSSCQNLVIEALKGGLCEGTRLGVSACYLDSRKLDRVKQGESLEEIFKVSEKQTVIKEEEEVAPRKAHDRSHHNVEVEERKKFRWPWEKIANKSLDGLLFESRKSQVTEDDDDDDDDDILLFDSTATPSSNKSKPALATTGQKSQSSSGLKIPKLNNQKFAFDKFQGFIYSLINPSLVLAVSDIDKNLIEVSLMKRNDDNPLQRWVYTTDGSILLKCRQTLALTVRLPSLDAQPPTSFLTGRASLLNDAPLILQSLISGENGNANQKWFIEDQVGLIFAFAPTYDRAFDPNDRLNIDVTAASKALICTGYVAPDRAISQPGFACQMPAGTVLVCGCCGVAVRGRFKLTRLTREKAFACHFSQSVKQVDDSKQNSVIEKSSGNLRFSGLKYLDGKVDLTSDSASEKSFAEWKEKFMCWREMSSVVANEAALSVAVSSASIIKLYAYRNGDGRLKAGELLIGTSLNDLLVAATGKLRLNSAARRFYTQDGSLILDVQDLVTWCIGFYRRQVQADTDKEGYTRQPKVSAKELARKSESTGSEEVAEAGGRASTGSRTAKGRGLTMPNRNDLKRLVYEVERLDRSRTADLKKVLKWPVEVWVSCGEAFVAPEVVSMNEGQKTKQREAVEKAERQMERRVAELRTMGAGSGEELATKQAEIERLKNYIDDVRNPKRIPAGKRLTSGNNNSFGSHSVTKRIFVYSNGQSSEKAKSCWASSLDELNEVAFLKLGLAKPVKHFFAEDGSPITKFEEIGRDQVVCVSTGREFIPASMANRDVEIKANWSRTCKEEGLKGTMINVNGRQQKAGIDVDPFEGPKDRKQSFIAIEDKETAELRDRFFNSERSKSIDSIEG